MRGTAPDLPPVRCARGWPGSKSTRSIRSSTAGNPTSRVRHPAHPRGRAFLNGLGGSRRRPGGDPGRAPQPAPRPAHRPRAVGSVTGRAGIYRTGCVTRRAGAEDGAAVDTPRTRRHQGVFLVTVDRRCPPSFGAILHKIGRRSSTYTTPPTVFQAVPPVFAVRRRLAILATHGVRVARVPLHPRPSACRRVRPRRFVYQLAPLQAFIDPGKPWQNGTDESINGKFRNECLSLEWFRNRTEANVGIERWRRHYNEERPYMSLGGLTPAEFKAQVETTHRWLGESPMGVILQ